MASAVPTRRTRRTPTPPLRIVTAVPLCDGHDSAIMTVNHELVRQGAEVIYLGYHQAASAIARAAIQEDADAIGISSYNGGHVVFFREVLAQLRRRGARDIAVVGGGGGTITPADERALRRIGVNAVFSAGTPLERIVAEIRQYARPHPPDARLRGDRALARAISIAENRASSKPTRAQARTARPTSDRSSSGFVLGIAGPGGAGKSTLIDELVFRFLREPGRGRIAVLANDPSRPGGSGALLGDRVAAIYASDDRVFFRSLATRGGLQGISVATPQAIDVLRASGEFELILVESVGIGQESDPFRAAGSRKAIVDAVALVLPPHYGGRIQLEKIGLLQSADVVVLNKGDDPRAATARADITAALRLRRQPAPLLPTIAAQHQDPGVDRLYALVADLAGLEPAGGERACQLRIHG